MKKFYFLLLALGLFTGVNAQIVNIPDANFKAKLLAASPSYTIAKDLTGNYFKIDTNSDGEIQESEALQVSYLSVASSNISSLLGILSFTNIQTLYCVGNQLSTLDISGLSSIIDLNCQSNQITNLNIIGASNLVFLNCEYNQLTNLDVNELNQLDILNCSNNQLMNLNVSQNTNLHELYCSKNQLLSLNVTQNLSLIKLECDFNQISNIDVSNNINLSIFYCDFNQINNIDVTNNLNLFYFGCSNNQITNLNLFNNRLLLILACYNNFLNELDVSNNIELDTLLCGNNSLLTFLNIKNGNFNFGIGFEGCPNLEYICANEFNLSAIQDQITFNGYTNCHVNNYCSFTPGGTFYTIQGNNKFDSNNNGCDINDVSYQNLKFSITDGINTGSVVSNVLGSYTIPVQAGTHTITPVLENPTYFIISPSTVNVTFPTQASPFTQDFCVTANGVHSDVEVTILPIVGARPGFDATYKIIYKNKGNQVENGSVILAFDDAKIDYVSANPNFNSQSTNQLTWNYSGLQPFETRTIDVVLNINTPMETLPVNGGDVLNYTATITSGNTDEMPSDNLFTLNQIVVNSYDPNDKTCLEGATIPTSKVGDYVHYMIRFENNGTANAQNIVVKDMIDLAKFDINSLVPIKGSHSFVTNITSGNKVEFIFENINLPFDDANNDGYLAFKIKTKPTLVSGDTFSNTASIYFDYNFPIVTNTATTTIAALSRHDFEFSNYFSLYPNPVHNVLNITAKETIEISSINIYNILGQLVVVIPNAKESKTVDVSSLTSGNYFIKINSDKGTSNTKFIKQ